MPLIENELKPFAKSVLIPLGLRASASATDAALHQKTFGLGTRPRMLYLGPLDLVKQTTLIIPNEEMNDVIKIVTSPEEPGLLIKFFSETIKNEAKEQKGGFFSMILCKLVATLLGNLLAGKGTTRNGEGTIRAGEGTIRVDQDF